MWLLLATLLVQAPPASPLAADPPVVSLDRIRRGLEASGVRVELPPPDRRLFKVFVEQPKPFEFPVMWKDQGFHPGYVHTPAPPVHHEFLGSVTPEQFRAGVQYPVGIPVLTILRAVGKVMAQKDRARKEREIREQIRGELAALEAARAALAK